MRMTLRKKLAAKLRKARKDQLEVEVRLLRPLKRNSVCRKSKRTASRPKKMRSARRKRRKRGYAKRKRRESRLRKRLKRRPRRTRFRNLRTRAST